MYTVPSTEAQPSQSSEAKTHAVMGLFELVAGQQLRKVDSGLLFPRTSPQAVKRSEVSWVERIEAALQSSGGQASVAAIMSYIESHHPDVTSFNYNWQATVNFTLQGNEQFKKIGNECGGVWRLIPPKPEVPPWEIKLSLQEEEIRAGRTSRRMKRSRSRSQSRDSSRRRKHKGSRRGSSSRSRSPESSSRDSKHHKSRRKSRSKREKHEKKDKKRKRSRSEESRRHLKHSESDRSESSTDSSQPDGVTELDVLSSSGGGGDATPANYQVSAESESAQEDRELHQHVATSAKEEHHTGKEEANDVSSSSLQEGAEETNKELDGRSTSNSESQNASHDEPKDDKNELEEAKQKDDSQGLLDLYLKQYQQEKQEHQSDQTAQAYDMSAYGGYYAYGYYGYDTGMAGWEQYAAQYQQTAAAAWTEAYAYAAAYAGQVPVQPPADPSADSSLGLTEEGGEGKKKGKKPTPEFWKAYKEKKRRKKAATRFNLKG